jgi:hypothetical protein
MERADYLADDIVLVRDPPTQTTGVQDVTTFRVVIDVHDAWLTADLHFADAHRSLLVQLVRELGNADDTLEAQPVVAVEQVADDLSVAAEDIVDQLSLHPACPG